jgi:hypothetical protein
MVGQAPAQRNVWQKRSPEGSTVPKSANGRPKAVEEQRQISLSSATFALALTMVPPHIRGMAKSPRVVFKLQRVAEGDWQVQAHCPGVDIRYVNGFKTKAEVDEWLNGDGKIRWLRSQGYAK